MNPFALIIDIILSFYTSVVLLRFFMQYFRVDYYNPISQLVVKATDPLVKPLRRIIPGFGGLDMASLMLAWLVVIAHSLIIALLTGSLNQIPVVALLVLSIFGVIEKCFSLFMFLIFVRAIISWVAPANAHSPVMAIFAQLTEPFLSKIRSKLPPMQGFDLSPMIAILVLLFISSSISYYIMPVISKLLA